MSTVASSRTPPRRPLTSHNPSSSTSRGATARSGVATARASSPLRSSSIRRPPPPKSSSTPQATINEGSKDPLEVLLKEETERKEQLIVELQNRDQTISNLTSENDQLTSTLNAIEARVNEFYADQSRMEDEMAVRIEVAEKLRAQVRDLEREKRDQKRIFDEQSASYEAERQAWYDNEQHLKSRIQSLSQSRRQPITHATTVETTMEEAQEEEGDVSSEIHEGPRLTATSDKFEDDDEPAEMTALKLELSTLSTSYNSLQSSTTLLQSQLAETGRVNRQLQEENESYMILLREKTLSGQFNVMRQMGTVEEGKDDDASLHSFTSGGRSSQLDRVEEETAEDSLEQELKRSLGPLDNDSPTSHHGRHAGRTTRKRTSSASPDAPHGESLADLPISGPGLDLAAELGRAENKDTLDGDDFQQEGKKPRERKRSFEPKQPPGGTSGDVDALRNEVKSLKDANKALSLYASKIIDRIIMQEGFEHVLAADFDKTQSPTTPTTFNPKNPSAPSSATIKVRPQSAMLSSTSALQSEGTSKDERRRTIMPAQISSPPINNPSTASTTTKANRRSLSFDWKNFAMFGGGEKKMEPSNLRPLTLKPGAAPVTGARKLETQEDEDDRRERERLNATMKLMGIEPPQSPKIVPSPLLDRAASPPSSSANSPQPPPSRFSAFFRRATGSADSDTSSVTSAQQPPNLTHDALEQAEAVSTLAALDAHEQALSVEIAKGGASGFTELPKRGADRRNRRRSRISGAGSGSGSTVWSAGMSGEGDLAEE